MHQLKKIQLSLQLKKSQLCISGCQRSLIPTAKQFLTDQKQKSNQLMFNRRIIVSNLFSLMRYANSHNDSPLKLQITLLVPNVQVSFFGRFIFELQYLRGKGYSNKLITYFPENNQRQRGQTTSLDCITIIWRGFKLTLIQLCLIIIYMHRYGLVYLWHNKQLQNQNRSVTKERRDGQPPSPPRNKNPLQQRPQDEHPKHLTSINSELQRQASGKMEDIQAVENVEIGRLKRARRRFELTGGDLEQAQKRLSQLDAGFRSLARGNSKSAEAYNNLLQLAKKETERLQKERFKALSQLQSKEQLLAHLQQTKCSI